GIVMEQTDFTPDRVAAEIARLAARPDNLDEMAAAARGQGILDGADRLADLVVRVAGIKAAKTPSRSESPLVPPTINSLTPPSRRPSFPPLPHRPRPTPEGIMPRAA